MLAPSWHKPLRTCIVCACCIALRVSTQSQGHILTHVMCADTLAADCSTTTVITLYEAVVLKPIKKLFHQVKTENSPVLHAMQQHPLVLSTSENGPLQRRIIYKLFVHKMNGLLLRAAWDPRRPVSSIFKPFAEVLFLW